MKRKTMPPSESGAVSDAEAFARVVAFFFPPPLRDEVDKEAALRAVHALKRVEVAIGGLLLKPLIAVGNGGKVLFYWESEEHYLEIESLPQQAEVELFYRNRRTHQYHGEDWNAHTGTPLPEAFYEPFQRFVRVLLPKAEPENEGTENAGSPVVTETSFSQSAQQFHESIRDLQERVERFIQGGHR